MADPSDCFHLKGNDNVGFNTKQKDIFQQLESLETKYNNGLIERFSTDDNKEDHRDVDAKRSVSEPFRFPHATPPKTIKGRDRTELSMSKGPSKGQREYRARNFKEPKMDFNNKQTYSSWKRKSRQDYSNPAKWTKYSLEDTDIGSESQNKRTALQFLAEQRTRNRESATEVVVNLDDKITFSKPSTEEMNEREETKTKMYGNVYRMPECVVGARQKPKHKAQIQPQDEPNAGHVQLDFEYLQDADEDELNKETGEQKDEKIKFRKNKPKKSIRKRENDDT